MPDQTPAAYLAFTAPVNPSGATPVLTRDQIWQALQKKVYRAQDFVGAAITETEIVKESHDDQGRPVVTRIVTFKEGNRKVEEVCTFFEPGKVEFIQPNGSRVMNIIADGADGQLYMTYNFEWMLSDVKPEERASKEQQFQKMAQVAVDHSIEAIREMVSDGRIK